MVMALNARTGGWEKGRALKATFARGKGIKAKEAKGEGNLVAKGHLVVEKKATSHAFARTRMSRNKDL